MLNSLKLITKLPGFAVIARMSRFMRRSMWAAVDLVGCIVMASFMKRASRPVKKILLIRLDRVGDMVLTTPAIRAMRLGYPYAQVHVLAREYNRDVILNNININKIILFEKEPMDRDYDIAVAFHPGFKQNYLAYKSGAFKRVGYSGRGGAFFLTKILSDDRATRIRHEVDSALELAVAAGGKADDKHLDISVTSEGELFAKQFLDEHGLAGKQFVIMHPGARQAYIQWKPEGFAWVADKLIEDYKCVVVLTGLHQDKRTIERVVAAMKNKPVVLIDLSLTRVISVMRRACLFIGNSTGPLHIAAALGIKIVAVFGSRHPLDSFDEWGPWGGKAIIISKDPGCQQCQPTECFRYRCMEIIAPIEVYEATKKQLDDMLLNA